jgi:hypothetical protein
MTKAHEEADNRQVVKQEVRPEVRPEVKQEVRPEVKPEIKPEVEAARAFRGGGDVKREAGAGGGDYKQFFRVGVYVGGEQLPMIQHGGDEWVVVRFNHDGFTKMVTMEEQDPYGEKYEQQWAATPYWIKVSNDAYGGPVEVKVTVDGVLACREILYEGQLCSFSGFQSRPHQVQYGKDTISEFLFTTPRAGQVAANRAVGGPREMLERIVVEFIDVDFTGQQVLVPVVAPDAVGAVIGASKAEAHDVKASSTTVSGVQIRQAVEAVFLGNVYTRVDTIAEMTVRYGTKWHLQKKNVLPDEEALQAVHRKRVRENEKENEPVTVDLTTAGDGGVGTIELE